MLKGDATFSTTQRILGWDVKSAQMNITLPSHRQDRLTTLLTTFLQQKYTTKRKWQQLLGEHRSMSLAPHSTKYLFSILQYPLRQCSTRRFRIPLLAHTTLRNWMDLLQALHTTPVPIAMVVPHTPHFWAASDASSLGFGGFWLPSSLANDTQPYVWRLALAPAIKQRLLTTSNPAGDITINDLELAATCLGYATQLHHSTLSSFTSTCIATDNTPAAAWVTKGSPTMVGPPTFLLRQLALESRKHNAALTALYTPGTTNIIADFLSRSFHLTDDELFYHLQHLEPIQPP